MLCCITLILYTGLLCWAAYVRRILYSMPIGVNIHIRVDTAQKEVNVFSAEVHLFTIDNVYTDSSKMWEVKIHLWQRYQNPKNPKLFLLTKFHHRQEDIY